MSEFTEKVKAFFNGLFKGKGKQNITGDPDISDLEKELSDNPAFEEEFEQEKTSSRKKLNFKELFEKNKRIVAIVSIAVVLLIGGAVYMGMQTTTPQKAVTEKKAPPKKSVPSSNKIAIESDIIEDIIEEDNTTKETIDIRLADTNNDYEKVEARAKSVIDNISNTDIKKLVPIDNILHKDPLTLTDIRAVDLERDQDILQKYSQNIRLTIALMRDMKLLEDTKKEIENALAVSKQEEKPENVAIKQLTATIDILRKEIEELKNEQKNFERDRASAIALQVNASLPKPPSATELAKKDLDELPPVRIYTMFGEYVAVGRYPNGAEIIYKKGDILNKLKIVDISPTQITFEKEGNRIFHEINKIETSVHWGMTTQVATPTSGAVSQEKRDSNNKLAPTTEEYKSPSERVKENRSEAANRLLGK